MFAVFDVKAICGTGLFGDSRLSDKKVAMTEKGDEGEMASEENSIKSEGKTVAQVEEIPVGSV